VEVYEASKFGEKEEESFGLLPIRVEESEE
jgi:hypothetical protein